MFAFYFENLHVCGTSFPNTSQTDPKTIPTAHRYNPDILPKNLSHDHPNAILSGAFYLTGGNAPIVFRHPFRDISTYFWDKSIVEEWNGANSGEWNILPELNNLLVFPAWVEHKVNPNKEDTDRISLSFNTVLHETEKENE